MCACVPAPRVLYDMTYSTIAFCSLANDDLELWFSPSRFLVLGLQACTSTSGLYNAQ